MKLDSTTWHSVSTILDELLDADATHRDARLMELKRSNPALADEVGVFLAHQAAAESERFLDGSAAERVDGGMLTEGTLTGRSVGDYTLDRPIGDGGMGTVWLARRSDGHYEGLAAVKFLNWALLGSGGAQRLRREASVLAKLAHPNITHLIDAGVAAGQPYLVLEYVAGERIDRWCDGCKLDVTARIRLFQQVLAAVSHAHSRMILHRDLKPSNILVTADGRAKLLDFGIAKLLHEDRMTPMTELTRGGAQGFTPEYAAPEQVQRSEATMATDVYALGVLLYVLLTGAHPTAVEASTPMERLQALIEREPRRMSEVVLLMDPVRASARAASPHPLHRLLRGDLDNIVAKALRKHPAERYQSVEAFAADLQRYVNDEPVSARADSLAYRMRKFTVRNALPVAAASIVLIAIVLAAAVSMWQAREATRQRDRALALSARSFAVAGFVTTMLTKVAPGDRAIPVSELLERSERLLLASDEDPEHQAAILDLIAEYSLSNGNPGRALPLLDRSIELTASSADAALRATLICNRGYALSLLQQSEAALTALEQGTALSRVDPLAAARCLQRRAYLAQNANDPRAALAYTLEARAQLHQAHISDPRFEASLLTDLAYAHYLSGHTAEADRYYAEALERFTQLGLAETPSTFSLRNNWAIASYAAGDNRRALGNYDEALRLARQHNPDVDPPVYLLSNRASALASLARYQEALDAFDVALAAAQRSNSTLSVLHALVNRVNTYLLMGDVDRAARELADMEARYGDALPPDSVPAISIPYVHARLALARSQPERALAEAAKVIAFFDERQMAVAPLTRALSTRAEAHLRLGNLDAARADAQRALQISRKLQDAKPFSSLTGYSLLQLAEVERAAGAAAQSRTSASSARQHLSETLGADHHDTLRAKGLAGA